MNVRTADVNLDSLFAQRFRQELVTSTTSLVDHPRIHRLPHPAWASKNDRPQTRVSERNVPHKSIIHHRVKLGHCFLVLRRPRSGRFARYGSGDAMGDQREMLRQQTERCAALPADDGTHFRSAPRHTRLCDTRERDAVPALFFFDPNVSIDLDVECVECPELHVLVLRCDSA